MLTAAGCTDGRRVFVRAPPIAWCGRSNGEWIGPLSGLVERYADAMVIAMKTGCEYSIKLQLNIAKIFSAIGRLPISHLPAICCGSPRR